MAVLTRHLYRLAFPFGKDQDEWLDSGACKNTLLQFPSGVSVRFQIGVFVDTENGMFYDMSQVTGVICEVKRMIAGQGRPSAIDPTYIASSLIAPESATITPDGWAEGIEQHATFDFNPSETALDPGNYWLVFSGFTPESVSFGWGAIEIVEDGTGPVLTPAPLDPSYYTSAQVDALIQSIPGGSGSPEIYDPQTYVEQSDENYFYFAWARIDATGYIATRRDRTTKFGAGTFTGPLPIAADLSILIYT